LQGRIAKVAALSGPLRTVGAEFFGAPDPEHLADADATTYERLLIFFSYLKPTGAAGG
jgi:hypothetical protein